MGRRQIEAFAFMIAVTCFTAPMATTMLGYIAQYDFGLSRLEIRIPAVVGAVIGNLPERHDKNDPMFSLDGVF